MRVFYRISVNAYTLAIRIASLWNPKAKKWVKGRKNVDSKLKAWQNLDDLPVYWFHCASLGEFEQGRPIIEALKEKMDVKVVVTFFSPSGYEIRKNYELADLVLYLPIENRKNCATFLDTLKPSRAFFIKYEFWLGYLEALEERKIPTYSVAAVFRKDQLFFKWYGRFMQRALQTFSIIFVQNQQSKELLNTIGISSVLSGDTRYDRVMQNAANVTKYPAVERFLKKSKCLVVGSSWEKDEEVLEKKIKTLTDDWKVILAPHEIDEKHLVQIEERFQGRTIRYSMLEEGGDENHQILIIDNIGMLSNLYQYGKVAYVGGAFGSGLHNILEPAAFGLPVVFGNQYDKFQEGYDFIDAGIGFSINDSSSFSEVFETLASGDYHSIVTSYMEKNRGACELILNKVQ